MSQAKSYSGWWIAFAIATCAIPIGIFLFTGGSVTGEEFSPDDFTRRRFNYNKLPLLDVVIKGIKYDDSTPVFEQTLSADQFIGKTTGKKTWHLISDNVSNQKSPDFDAKFLIRYLDLVGENGESIWFQWNENHPHLAKEFWPVIAGLSRESLYLDVADLMLKAVSLDQETEADFREFMKKHAVLALARKAEIAANNANDEDSVRLYSRIIEIQPSIDAYRRRAKAFDALGDVEKYKQDLEAAKNLE